MAKDSFLIYKSFYAPIKSLSDKQLGRLFRALFDYQIERSMNVDSDLQMAFAFFKNQFDLDESKYQKVIERNRQNGSKGGRPTNEENPENPMGYFEPKKPDNDNDNDNDNDLNIPPYPQMGESDILISETLNSEKKEKEKKVPAKKEKEVFDLSFVNIAFVDTIKDFIEYRKKIKKPYKTIRGVETFYDELIKLSGNNLQKAKELIKRAKDKEWQTVYPIKENETNQWISKTSSGRNLESLAFHIEQGIARGKSGRN